MLAAAPLTQAHTFHLDAPLSHVMPMFTALGEKAWAEGWNPQLLSGETERGSAFITQGHDGGSTVWVVVAFRPSEGRVSYARLATDSNIGLVDVSCVEAPAGGTDVEVRYTLTPMSESGRHFVDRFLDAGHFAAMIETWREAVSRALRLPPTSDSGH